MEEPHRGERLTVDLTDFDIRNQPTAISLVIINYIYCNGIEYCIVYIDICYVLTCRKGTMSFISVNNI